MKKLTSALIVILVIFVCVYLLTRSLPEPNPPSVPHKKDPKVTSLLISAKLAATVLYVTIDQLSSTVINGHIKNSQALVNSATNAGLSTPSMNSLMAAIASTSREFTRYLNLLSKPGCDSMTEDCGYYADIANASVEKNTTGDLIRYASNADSVALQVKNIVTSLQSTRDELQNIVNFILADSQAKNKNVEQTLLVNVQGDISQIDYSIPFIQQRAEDVRKSGNSLLTQLVTPV